MTRVPHPRAADGAKGFLSRGGHISLGIKLNKKLVES